MTSIDNEAPPDTDEKPLSAKEYKDRITRKSVVFDPEDTTHVAILDWFKRNKQVSFSAKVKQLILKDLIENNALSIPQDANL